MNLDKKKITIVVLFISNMFAQCCRALISPFYPQEASRKGVSETVIGLIFSSAEFTIFLTSPVFGSLMSYISPRFIYITGLCVYGCCEVMFGFLNQVPDGGPFIAICLAVRIVEATGTASILTASYTIAGHTYPDRIATVYSIIQTGVALGYTLGPAVGGVLYETGGYGLPFWTLASCVLFCACITTVILPPQDTARETSRKNTIFTLLKSPLVWLAVFYIMSFAMATTVYNPTLAQHLEQFGVGPAGAGYVFLIPPITFSLTAPVLGFFLDKFKFDCIFMAAWGLCGCVVTFMIFGPAPFLLFVPSTLWMAVLSVAVLGLFAAVVSVGGINSLVKGARELGFKDDGTTFGLVAGLSQTSSCCGGFIGPLLGGALTEYCGFSWSLATVGFLYIIPACAGFIVVCKRRRVKKGIGIRRPSIRGTRYNTIETDSRYEYNTRL